MPDRLDIGLRRRRLSMTSLIDVIFLLLLFFMLSSTFARQGELPLDLATGGATQAPETSPLFVQLRPEGLRLDSVEVELEGLREALIERGEGLVLVAMSGEITSQMLADILHLVRGVPGWQLAVLGAAP